MSTDGEYPEDEEYTPSNSTLADPPSSFSPEPSFPTQPPLNHQSSSRASYSFEKEAAQMDSQLRFESPRSHNNDSLFHGPPLSNAESPPVFAEEADELSRHGRINSLETTSLLGYDSINYGEDSADSYKGSIYEDEDPEYYNSLLSLFTAIVFIIGVTFVVALSGFRHLWAQRNAPKFVIKSDWKNNGEIPAKYGCNAEHPISIPLTWENVPEGATNMVVLFSSPDSDKVNWVVTDIPLKGANKVESLIANASAAGIPHEAHELPNSHAKNGHYYPPCHSARFNIHAYAIDDHATINEDTLKSSLKIMKSFVGVPTARISGTYAGGHGNDEFEKNHGDVNDSHENEAHDSTKTGHSSDDEDDKSAEQDHHAADGNNNSSENDHHPKEDHGDPAELDHHPEQEHEKPNDQQHHSEDKHAPSISHKVSRGTWRENLRKYS